ncbi:MAG: hypothetical protein SH859_03380 [Hyphomicrobium aestuarii]|nr:hypothetical protein [Hyphomicrobium aestuarii]
MLKSIIGLRRRTVDPGLPDGYGHPDAMVAGIWKWCQHTARRSLSPETRARHVASAFIDDLMAMRANERAEECAHGHASLKHKRLAG